MFGKNWQSSDPTERFQFLQRIILFLLFILQAVLLAFAASRQSPTRIEPAFLASGISHWEFGRFELYRVNPPLVRMVAALPVLAVGCQTDWSEFFDGPGARPEYAIGASFIEANGARTVDLIKYARWASIPFSILGAFVASRWSTELYGPFAGILTTTLFVIEPNLLAHGALITPDAACTAFGILAGYTFWRWLKRPSLTTVIAAGVSLGLALLSKMSWLILLPLWPALFVFWRWCGSRMRAPELVTNLNAIGLSSEQSSPVRCRLPGGFQLTAILGLGIYVVNLFYAFDGTGTALKEFDFVSTMLSGNEQPGEPGNRFRGSWLSELPSPVPKQYLLGFDTQKKDFEEFSGRSYLRGTWSDHGWWYYYIYGLFVKVPCGVLLIFVLGILSRWANMAQLRDEVVLMTPALVLLVLVSSQTEFNIHLRYVFPTLGFGLVFLGRAVSVGARWHSPRNLMIIVSTVWSASSMLYSYPHLISYFNETVGGAKYGHRHLMGSSLDWDQGTLHVVDRIIELGWKGPVKWETKNAKLAAAILEERRGIPTLESAEEKGTLSMCVYEADRFYDPERRPEYEEIVQCFPFGTVIVWKRNSLSGELKSAGSEK